MDDSPNPFPMDHWAQQSPIDLRKNDTLFADFGTDFLMIDYSGAPYAGRFEGKPGHKNFVLFKPGEKQSPPILTLGPVTAELIKIHVHTPAEHKLDGKQGDGEIHLIHEIKKPTGGSTLIVLGVFFNARNTRCVKSDFFQVWSAPLMPAAKQADSDTENTVMIDPNCLLPNTGKWFRYEGSLTSPEFAERVSWVVFPDTLGIRSRDLAELRKEAHQPERDTQPINRRFVLRNFVK
jgi:carbonic anhydrase